MPAFSWRETDEEYIWRKREIWGRNRNGERSGYFRLDVTRERRINPKHLLGWPELLGTLDLGSQHGTNLIPLHVCNSCVAWHECETPSSEIITCPWRAEQAFGNLAPMLDYLSQSILNLMCHALFMSMAGLPFYQTEMLEKEWIGRVVDGRQGLGDKRRGGRGHWWICTISGKNN